MAVSLTTNSFHEFRTFCTELQESEGLNLVVKNSFVEFGDAAPLKRFSSDPTDEKIKELVPLLVPEGDAVEQDEADEILPIDISEDAPECRGQPEELSRVISYTSTVYSDDIPDHLQSLFEEAHAVEHDAAAMTDIPQNPIREDGDYAVTVGEADVAKHEVAMTPQFHRTEFPSNPCPRRENATGGASLDKLEVSCGSPAREAGAGAVASAVACAGCMPCAPVLCSMPGMAAAFMMAAPMFVPTTTLGLPVGVDLAWQGTGLNCSQSCLEAAEGPAEQTQTQDAQSASDGEWTTLNFKHTPPNMQTEEFIKLLDAKGFRGKYDFVYFPQDFKRDNGLGYGFVNFTSSAYVQEAWKAFNGFDDWRSVDERFACKKKIEVQWGREDKQGLAKLIEAFRNAPVMHKSAPDSWKPVFLRNGVPQPFPSPTRKLKPIRLPPAHRQAAQGGRHSSKESNRAS